MRKIHAQTFASTYGNVMATYRLCRRRRCRLCDVLCAKRAHCKKTRAVCDFNCAANGT